MLGKAVDHGPQVEGGLTDPISQHHAAQIDAGPSVDLRLAVERQVIGIFGDQHVREQGLGGQGTLDQVGGRCGLGHGAGAAAAGVFRPDGHDHPELGRDNVAPLATVLPDPGHRPAAAGAKRARGLEHALDPRQLQRQSTEMTPDRGALLARHLQPPCAGSGLGRLDLRHGGLEILKRELPLVRAQPLRFPAVQRLPELPHQMLEPPVLLSKGFDLLLKGLPCRALGFDKGAQLGRQGGEVDLLRSWHGRERSGHHRFGGAHAFGVSHSAAAGRRTRRGP